MIPYIEERPLQWLAGALFTVALAVGAASGVQAQDQETPQETVEASDQAGVDQWLVDLDALIIATQVTTRCALFDAGTPYLSPRDETAVQVRMGELERSLAPLVPDLADQVSQMRSEANAIACGHEGLGPFLAFAEQVAADVTAIGLRAWASIDIDRCSYFADDEFIAAAGRARALAESDSGAGMDRTRLAYIETAAEAWVSLFERNCHNFAFDPTITLPGRIALAIPI